MSAVYYNSLQLCMMSLITQFVQQSITDNVKLSIEITTQKKIPGVIYYCYNSW